MRLQRAVSPLLATRRRFGRAIVTVLPVAAVLLGAVRHPAMATPQVTLASKSTYDDSIGYKHIVGEVQNTGSTNVDFVHLHFSFYDQANRLLATDSTYADVDTLAPNEKSPFDEIFKPQAGYDHYEVNLSAEDADAAPNHNFTTKVTNTFDDSIGYKHIVGEVTNNNATTAHYVEVIFTFYNSSGVVVDADSTFINGGEPTLAAGAKGTFEEIAGGSHPSYDHFVTLTQATDTVPSTAGSSGSSSFASGTSSSSTGSSTGTGAALVTVQAPTLALGQSSVTAGQTTTLTGSNWPANSTLQATLFSAPVVLGSFNSGSGSFTLNVTIPPTTEPGSHQLVVSQVPAGATASVSVAVVGSAVPVVVAPPTSIPIVLVGLPTALPASVSTHGQPWSRERLAFTGRNTGPVALAGALLLVVGAAGRRRLRRQV